MTDPAPVDRRGAVRILRKIVVALGLGALTLLVTRLADQPEIWSITLSVFIGGAALVVQVLIGFEHRLAGLERAGAAHVQKVEAEVAAGFTKISEVTELFSLVERSALTPGSVTQLVRNSTRFDPAAPPLLLRFAEAELRRTSELLKSLGQGEGLIYDGEDRDWLLSLTLHAQRSIDATSLTTVDAGGNGYIDGGFWSSDLGQRYLEAQRERVEQGVRIRRLFVIMHPADRATADALRVCRIHQQIGIQARVLDAAAIPGAGSRHLRDFILFDHAISYEVTPAARALQPAGPTIVSTRLEIRPDWVNGLAQRFESLWATAEEATGPVPVTR